MLVRRSVHSDIEWCVEGFMDVLNQWRLLNFGDWDKDTVPRKEQVDYIDVKVDGTLQLLSSSATGT